MKSELFSLISFPDRKFHNFCGNWPCAIFQCHLDVFGCDESAEPTDLCSALSDLIWQMRRAGVPVLASSEKFWPQGFLGVLELASRWEVCHRMAVTKFYLAGPAASVLPQLLQGLLEMQHLNPALHRLSEPVRSQNAQLLGKLLLRSKA